MTAAGPARRGHGDARFDRPNSGGRQGGTLRPASIPVLGFEQHPGKPWMHGQTSQFGRVAIRSQPVEELFGRLESVVGRRFKPRQGGDPEGAKFQQCLRQLAPLNFGNVSRRRRWKSSYEYNRIARPGRVRPARPALCMAEAFEIRRTCRVGRPVHGESPATRASPLSITVVTPSIVIELSASWSKESPWVASRASQPGPALRRQVAVERQNQPVARVRHRFARPHSPANLRRARKEHEHVSILPGRLNGVRDLLFQRRRSNGACTKRLHGMAFLGSITADDLPRYSAIGPALDVQDMTISFRSGRDVRCKRRSRASARSASKCRS